jgi:hypothetical protein
MSVMRKWLSKMQGQLFFKVGMGGQCFNQVHKFPSWATQGLQITGPGPYPNRDPFPQKLHRGRFNVRHVGDSTYAYSLIINCILHCK